MYDYKLAVLFLLCCFLLVDVTGRCPCQHRKRHRKCDSGSSDTHSSESSSESSERHKKHHSTSSTTTTSTTTTAYVTTGAPATCCPSGWIRFNKTNSCYLVQNNANWSDAEQVCVSKNAHLVSIHSEDEENFVLNLTRTGQPSSNLGVGVWIGLEAIITGKSFKWTDGSPVDYTKWGVSPNLTEPDGGGQFGSPANCVNVHPDTVTAIGVEVLTNAWDDDNCWAVMRAFVCKQSVHNC